jgi:hypothetical protein
MKRKQSVALGTENFASVDLIDLPSPNARVIHVRPGPSEMKQALAAPLLSSLLRQDC